MYYIISCCHWSRASLPQQIKCFSASLTFQFVVFWRCPFFLLIQHPSEFIFLTFAHLSFQIYANVFLWQTILFIYHFLLNLKDCGVMDTVPRKNEGFFSFYVSLCSCVCVQSCASALMQWFVDCGTFFFFDFRSRYSFVERSTYRASHRCEQTTALICSMYSIRINCRHCSFEAKTIANLIILLASNEWELRNTSGFTVRCVRPSHIHVTANGECSFY